MSTSNGDGLNFTQLSAAQPGLDITSLFSRDVSQIDSCLDPSIRNFTAVTTPLCDSTVGNLCPLQTLTNDTIERVYNLRNTSRLVGFDWEQLGNFTNYVVLNGIVLNFGSYFKAHPEPIVGDLIDTIIRKTVNTTHPTGGKDVTRLFYKTEQTMAAMDCIEDKYVAGYIDKETIGCFTSDLFNFIMLVIILGIVIVRFVMACVFNWFLSHQLALEPKEEKKAVISPQVLAGSYAKKHPAPWAHKNDSGSVIKTIGKDEIGNDLFTVLLITCYSEGEVGIRTTCDSMAGTDYPDDRKLLFLVCDGIITGSGNEKSTPDICVSLMEIEQDFNDPTPQGYIAVAAGKKRFNMAKVYAGYFCEFIIYFIH